MRPLSLAFVLVLTLTLTPYVLAVIAPPPGMAFLGTFHYADDFYNYLSYAQQAEDGSFLLHNKVLLADHPPALINLEWWLVGQVSRLLGGGHLLLAYRIFAVLATFGFLWASDLWLRRLGLPDTHRLPALLLVATGGGLGGVLFTLTTRDLTECLDLYAGLFPFLGLVTNPHFTAGTTLLLLGLLLFETGRGVRGIAAATAMGTATALVRPYDFVLMVLIRGLSVALLEQPRRWVAALAPLAGLLPVTAYLYWLFYRNPAFSFYAQTDYVFPPLSDLCLALAPVVPLGFLGFWPTPAGDAASRRARLHLLVWAGFGVVVVLARPVHFSLQFLGGIGLPFLALGALGLSRWRPAITYVAVVVFSTSFLATLRFVSTPRVYWMAPRSELAVADALRAVCRPGDILFSPPGVGLYAYGVSACRAFLSHAVGPGYRQRLEFGRRFGQMSPEDRLALLDSFRVSLLLLPGDAGLRPTAWLGANAPFVRRELGRAELGFSLYAREGRP